MTRLFRRKQPVLDEREMLEMYRIEHAGLWLMYALLVGAVLVQLFSGATMREMAGEVFVIVTVCVVMIIANARQGIWAMNARPSARDNAACSAMAGVAVAAVQAALGCDPLAALGSGAAAGLLCFLILMALMRYMKRRQEARERTLENE